jgi:hypothetical protein
MNSVTDLISANAVLSEAGKSASRSRLVRAMNCAPLRPTTTYLAGVLISVTILKRLALSGPHRPLSEVKRMMPRTLISRRARNGWCDSSTRSASAASISAMSSA